MTISPKTFHGFRFGREKGDGVSGLEKCPAIVGAGSRGYAWDKLAWRVSLAALLSRMKARREWNDRGGKGWDARLPVLR